MDESKRIGTLLFQSSENVADRDAAPEELPIRFGSQFIAFMLGDGQVEGTFDGLGFGSRFEDFLRAPELGGIEPEMLVNRAVCRSRYGIASVESLAWMCTNHRIVNILRPVRKSFTASSDTPWRYPVPGRAFRLPGRRASVRSAGRCGASRDAGGAASRGT